MYNIVIGVSGKIGNYYIKNSKNKKNIYLSRRPNKKKYIKKFNFLKNDINILLKKKKIISAVLFSGITDPLKCIENKKLSYKVNIDLTKKIINKFCKKNIYILFFFLPNMFMQARNRFNIKKIH